MKKYSVNATLVHTFRYSEEVTFAIEAHDMKEADLIARKMARQRDVDAYDAEWEETDVQITDSQLLGDDHYAAPYRCLNTPDLFREAKP